MARASRAQGRRVGRTAGASSGRRRKGILRNMGLWLDCYPRTGYIERE